MSTRTQDEVVTLDALRAAAKAIPMLPSSPPSEKHPSWQKYERARAEFWRLAYLWEGYKHSGYNNLTKQDWQEAEAIIAEVESRT